RKMYGHRFLSETGFPRRVRLITRTGPAPESLNVEASPSCVQWPPYFRCDKLLELQEGSDRLKVQIISNVFLATRVLLKQDSKLLETCLVFPFQGKKAAVIVPTTIRINDPRLQD